MPTPSRIKSPKAKAKTKMQLPAFLKKKSTYAVAGVLALAASCQGRNVLVERGHEAQRENFENQMRAVYPDAFAPAADLGVQVSRTDKYDSADPKGKKCCSVSFSRTFVLGTLKGEVSSIGITTGTKDDPSRNLLTTNARGDAVNYDERLELKSNYEHQVQGDVRRAFCTNSVVRYDGVEINGGQVFNTLTNALGDSDAVKDKFKPAYICTGGDLKMLVNGRVVAEGHTPIPRPIPRAAPRG